MAEEERSISRRDLPAVVKRAAELASRDADLSDEISEDEVIRIAAELGLAARHVKAAMYEGAREEAEPTFLDRQFGDRRIFAARAVPLDVERALHTVEAYFTTSEYMNVVRRQTGVLTLEPAADAVSRVARAFKRGSQHQLAAAQVLEVKARSLEPGWTHLSVRAVFKDERKGHFAGAVVGGTLLGSAIGAISGVLAGAVSSDMIVALTTGSVIGVGSGAAIFTGIVSSIRKNYREWRERTTMQTEGVLDRLEKGHETVRAEPSWLKKLQNLGLGG